MSAFPLSPALSPDLPPHAVAVGRKIIDRYGARLAPQARALVVALAPFAARGVYALADELPEITTESNEAFRKMLVGYTDVGPHPRTHLAYYLTAAGLVWVREEMNRPPQQLPLFGGEP